MSENQNIEYKITWRDEYLKGYVVLLMQKVVQFI